MDLWSLVSGLCLYIGDLSGFISHGRVKYSGKMNSAINHRGETASWSDSINAECSSIKRPS